MTTVSAQPDSLSAALWRIYRRPERPVAWTDGGNLPWNDPEFSQRMLREHLDQSHSAASRIDSERAAQIDWLWRKFALEPGAQVLDFTCGPGLYALELARRGCHVLGIDFSPASIAYGRSQVAAAALTANCQFIEADVRQVELPAQQFDAALFLYGQMAVFQREEAVALLAKIAESLKPGGRIVIELLNPDHIDKGHSTWWFTDDAGLWGDAPFINLGERFWDADAALSMERFYTTTGYRQTR
ncbi:MAG: class I SAM-dependent methyltransferase [Anaerolineales bacterium]|nr:class I SAM-dependent methyltransferase [Anaerolineales bacterium]